MKFASLILFLCILLSYNSHCNGKNTGACTFRTTRGENVFLSYYPRTNKGEEYVEFEEGKCIQRAVCQTDLTVKVDKCTSAGVTCDNVKRERLRGVYPACCVKCNQN